MRRYFLLLFVVAFACGDPPSQTAVTSEDGVDIAYSEAGAGETALVFVHGWTLDRSYWDAQMQHFSTEYRTVALDLAGHGESGAQRDEWSMVRFGHDVAAVVERLDPDRVVLVGHSMGGPVVLEASKLLTDRVAGIVLVDAFHDPDQRMGEEERGGIIAAYRDDFRGNVGSMVRQYFFAPETDSAFVERVVAQMSGFDPAIGVASIEELFASDYRDTFPRVTAPMAAINSELYPTNAESMSRYGISVRTMSGVGHFPMMEAPDRFNEVLEEILREWER